MIRTQRLSIRRIRTDDWRAIKEIWAGAAASEYARYDRPNDLEDEAVSRRIAAWASFADSDEHIFCAVCLRDAVIGYVAFNRTAYGHEIGYCFHPDHHGRGYARESIQALLDFMKEKGASAITAGTALNNTPSVGLLRSLGFRQTGTEKVSFYRDENGRDIVFDGGVFELSLS